MENVFKKWTLSLVNSDKILVGGASADRLDSSLLFFSENNMYG
jgi:hypothetical protein